MAGQHYYLLTALPALGELGAAPPVTRQEFSRAVMAADGPVDVVRALLLSDDLMQREAILTDEIGPEDLDLAVLPPAQARDEAPLPAEIAPQADEGQAHASRAASDFVWAAYFTHADAVARRTGSAFLRAWVGYEVALRNALAVERAKMLGLEPGDYMTVPHLADSEADVSQVLADWSAAEDPLAGLRVLDQARWEWLKEREAWFSFADDELAVYAARLMLLHRSRRLEIEKPE